MDIILICMHNMRHIISVSAELDNAYGYINNGLASDNTFQKELRLQEITYYEKIQDYDKAYELAKELYNLYPDYQAGADEYNFLYTRVSHDDE